MTTLEVLRTAREYISDPGRWYAGGFGDTHGRRCAVGACMEVNGCWTAAGDDPRHAVVDHAWDVLDAAACEIVGCESVQDVNDGMGHAAVLAVFHRAIAVEEAKAAEFTAASEPTPLVAA